MAKPELINPRWRPQKREYTYMSTDKHDYKAIPTARRMFAGTSTSAKLLKTYLRQIKPNTVATKPDMWLTMWVKYTRSRFSVFTFDFLLIFQNQTFST